MDFSPLKSTFFLVALQSNGQFFTCSIFMVLQDRQSCEFELFLWGVCVRAHACSHL